MQIINFKKNQIAGFIVADGIDYIRVGSSIPVPAYKHFPTGNNITPTDTGNWQFTDSEDVIVDPNDRIEDGNNFIYAAITGPRPKNIIRR